MTIIVGAGLGGLVLGQWMKAKNIPVTILERASFPALRDYGITLHRSIYQRLLPVLQRNEASFLKECSIEPDSAITAQTFRCHRGRVENFLRKDLDIRWGQRLEGVRIIPHGVSLEIEDGPNIESNTLIGADGVHSLIRNSCFVLPYDVFNGSRSITLESYQHRLQPFMEGHAVMQALHGNVLFQVYVKEFTATAIHLGYTYSRPAHISDAMHQSDRPTTGADKIPNEFYAELSQYSEKQLGPGFAEVFDSEKNLADVDVWVIGDAAHPMTILGGEGTNQVINHALDLAEHLLNLSTSNKSVFLERNDRDWRTAVHESEKRL